MPTATKTAKTNRPTVSATDFVRGYLTATTIGVLVAEWGVKPASIRFRANKLRKAGVRLPNKFQPERGGSRLNIDDLNTLVQSIQQPQATAVQQTQDAAAQTTSKPARKGGKAK